MIEFSFCNCYSSQNKGEKYVLKRQAPLRQAPRTMNEAFGPYSLLEDIQACKRHERYVAIAGVILLGAFLGLLFGWRG